METRAAAPPCATGRGAAAGYLPSLPRKGMETHWQRRGTGHPGDGMVTYHHFPARGWKLTTAMI